LPPVTRHLSLATCHLPLVTCASIKKVNFKNMSTFVTVAVFTYAHEAAIPKARLESEGILCFLRDEHTLFLQPFFSSAGGGIKLQVNAEDVEDAIRVLEDNGYETEGE
jgi:hypothetical protein